MSSKRANDRPADPNVKIPAAVIAAAAQSDELHKKVYSKDEPAAQGEPSDGQNPETPPATPPAPQAESSQEAPQGPASPPAENVTHQGNHEDEEKSWKHKFDSMKGRFDRAQTQIRDLTSQIANLQAVIASMQTPPATTSAAEPPKEQLLTPEEVENYGQDFLAVVGKKAKEEVTPQVKALQEQIASLQQQLASVTGAVVQDARQRLFETMDRELPNWRELNHDEKFISWLGLPDPYSGAIRHDLLKAAFEQNNAPRVLAFFKGFLAEEAATSPAPAARPDPQTPSVERVPLEALAAPGRAKTAATPPAEKPIITRAQISKFYVDKAAGKYRGREDEATAFEKQIFEATREGRIR